MTKNFQLFTVYLVAKHETYCGKGIKYRRSFRLLNLCSVTFHTSSAKTYLHACHCFPWILGVLLLLRHLDKLIYNGERTTDFSTREMNEMLTQKGQHWLVSEYPDSITRQLGIKIYHITKFVKIVQKIIYKKQFITTVLQLANSKSESNFIATETTVQRKQNQVISCRVYILEICLDLMLVLN